MSDPEKREELLMAINAKWSRALQSRNLVDLQAILDDDFKIIGKSGFRIGKQKYLEFVSSDEKSVEPIGEVRAQIFGDGALVSGRSLLRAQGKYAYTEGEYRYTNFYTRKANTWIAIASHSSEIKSSA
jgi:hypothetical protein